MSENESRIRDKIAELEGYLDYLVEMVPEGFEEYCSDLKTKAACERYFEKVVEASIDMAFLIIKEKNLEMPEDEESSFVILEKSNIISHELAGQLIDFKGMRNILAHKYGKVDDDKVYSALSGEVERDINNYIRRINAYLKGDKNG